MSERSELIGEAVSLGSTVEHLRKRCAVKDAEIERLLALLDRAADELERISMPEDDVDGLLIELRGHQQGPRTDKP